MNRNLLEAIARHTIHYRWIVLIVSLLLMFLSLGGYKNLSFDGSTDIWFLQDDPVLVEYERLKERFENNEYLVVGIRAGEQQRDVLEGETLAAIGLMTDFLEAHPAVTKTASLSKYQYMRSKNDFLEVEDIVPEESENFDLTEAQRDKMRNILVEEKIALNILFTKDLKNTVITARVIEQKNYTGEGTAKNLLVQDFKRFIAENGLTEKEFTLYLSGSATISESYFSDTVGDQSTIFPMVLTLILILLYMLFRTWVGVVLPTLIVMTTVTTTVGIMGFIGWPFNLLNSNMPIILMVIALADSIHLVVAFYRARHAGEEPAEAAQTAIRKHLKPCVYTTLTTAFGFLALASSKLAPVQEFGLAMPIGVVLALIFSVFLLPAMLSFVKSVPKLSPSRDGFITRWIDSITQMVLKRQRGILMLFGGLIIPVLLLCATIEVDTNFVRNFKEDSTIRQGLDHFDTSYKGALSLEFMLDSGKEEGVKEPEFLKRALEFQEYVSAQQGSGKANSYINYLVKINQSLHNEDPAYYKIPETREMVGQYLLLYSNSGPEEDLSDLMTFDGRYMRISVNFEVAPSSVTKARVEAIQQQIDSHYQDLNITVTGRAVLFNKMDVYVLEGLITSFSIAFLIITICFLVLLRSFRYGLPALIPNLIPILAAGAVMGLFGIYLDFSTLIIAAVTLGIAVDDTIHVMSHYVDARRKGVPQEEAIQQALHISGPALTTTTIVLIAGFSMMIFSTFVPNMFMAVLGSTVILFALIVDLILLPAIILRIDADKSVATAN